MLLVSVLFFVTAFSANRVLRPARPADPIGKRATYECGLDPVGADWAQMQIRYYVYAYLYVLFAVEAVFLFPWAVVFDRPGFGLVTVVEMAVFVAVLALGILYAWRRNILRWT
ncbi:NADH-ubiquinone oxidoreductase subunit 3 [Micromonospora sp. NRRL B-16802]|nr:NADH-ubiquinone oxidoreductase subunit 3 [Micromonospora sp. NRRL B-16802]